MLSLFLSAVSVAAVVIAVAGLTALGIGLRRLVAARASSKWPSVQGEILTSKVVEEDDADGGKKTFRASITYRYSVGEKVFEGDRTDLNDLSTSDPGPATDLTRSFPAGSKADIFYDPATPQNSTLKPGISGASAILPAVGVTLVVLGLSMFGIAWKVSGH